MTADFRLQIDQELTQLDEEVSELAKAIDDLRSVHPVRDINKAQEAIVAASRRAAALHTRVAEAAERLEMRTPSWRNRPELNSILGDMATAIDRAFGRPRAFLRDLAAILGQHVVVHPRSSQASEQRNRLRERAREELVEAANRPEPPTLPGPEQPPAWLPWAWQLAGEEFSRLEELLRGFFLPALGDLVREVEPAWWQLAQTTQPPQETKDRSATSVVEIASSPTIENDLDASRRGNGKELSNAEVAEVRSSEPSAAADPSDGATTPLEQQSPPGGARTPVRGPEEMPASHLSSVESAAASLSLGGITQEAAPALPAVPRSPSANGEPQVPGPHRVASSPPAQLPEHLKGFDAFQEQNWWSPSSRCEPAPWRDAGFADVLRKATIAGLQEERFFKLWLFARAAEQLELEPMVSVRDVEALAAILAMPPSPAAGVDAARTELVAEKAERVEAINTPAWRMRVFLEAVRPSSESYRLRNKGEFIVDADMAAFADADLKQVVRALLDVGSMGLDPIERLRADLGTQPTETPAQIRERLERKRAEFRSEVRKKWSAAGGQVARTHCRRAWDQFIDEVAPTLKALYPVAAGGLEESNWDPKEMRKHLSRLISRHDEIADVYNARLRDRMHMDGAARSIAMAANDLNEEMARLKDATTAVVAPRAIAAVQAVRHLLAAQPLTRPEEEVCRRVLIRLVEPKATPAGSLLDILGRDLCAYPGLLGLIDGLAVSELIADGSMDRAIARPNDISDPVRAAALLVNGSAEPLIGSHSKVTAFEWLRNHCERRQPELLERLAPSLGQHDVQRLHRERADLLESIYKRIAGVERAWRAFDELALPLAQELKAVADEGRRRAEAEDAPSMVVRMLQAWLDRILEFADQARRIAAEFVTSRIPDDHPDRTQLVARVRAERFAEVLLALGEGASVRPGSNRETEWRANAVLSFAERWPKIEAAAAKGGDGQIVIDLLSAWKMGVTGQTHQSDFKLRSNFFQFVFGARQRKDSLARDGANQNDGSFLPMAPLRRWLRDQKLNPSFLPQLGQFKAIAILTPPVPPSSPSFAQKVAALAVQHDGSLTFVLAPKLTAERRDETLRELRKRENLAVALVDDIDLLRLINPGGPRPNAVIGLCEIGLEQQRWVRMSPFTASDGQHVQMEMYVGRVQEAEDLAASARYSRLFSGRRLGKSALLRFIEDNRDGATLPSGCTLRVLYVPIPGATSESDVVHRILQEMDRRLDFRPNSKADGRPGDRLAEIIAQFVREQPATSLLVFLDEADQFVEAQLEEYEQSREACLSFRIRTDVESHKDAMGLPRVRFIFSGYRATHTTGGAWANWGDIRRLAPLQPEEAAALIAGPLARLGIDAAEEAPLVAWRCGYQPAVLLRFGHELLEHLERRRGAASRDRDVVRVTADDVAQTISRPSVQDEIRTVAKNNFQGNQRGWIIFSTVLLEFAEHTPAEGLDDLSGRILERLRLLDSDVSWLRRSGSGSGLPEVANHIRDLVDRQLLVERPAAGGRATVHGLRFPHHLPILLPAEPEAAIRDEIAILRREGNRPDDYRGMRAIIPEALLIALSRAVCEPPDPDFPIGAAVVGTHWFAAAQSPSRGIPDRLGIDPKYVVPAGHPTLGLRLTDAPRVAVIGAAAADFGTIVAARGKNRPAPLIIGGADLYRAALRDGGLNELASLGRLTVAQLGWWFQKVRVVEFGARDAIQRMISATSGIPLLVDALEELVLGPTRDGGVNVSVTQLDEAFRRLELRLPEIAQRLRSGPPAISLEPREIEILRMLAVASRENRPGVSLHADLTTLWDDYYRPQADVEPLSDADRIALELVQGLGLVAIDADRVHPLERLIAVGADDLLHRLVSPVSPTQ